MDASFRWFPRTLTLTKIRISGVPENVYFSNILAEWRGVLVTPVQGDSRRIPLKVSDLTSRSLQGALHSAKVLLILKPGLNFANPTSARLSAWQTIRGKLTL